MKRPTSFASALGGAALFFILLAPARGQNMLTPEAPPDRPPAKVVPAPAAPVRDKSGLLLPGKRGDVSCGVADWTPASATPVLTLVCPPAEVYAPLHVFLQFSWRTVDDVPTALRAPGVQPRGLARLRTTETEHMVQLQLSGQGGKGRSQEWVRFTRLVNVGLLGSEN